MANRDKAEPGDDPNAMEQRAARRFVLFLLPMIVVAPNVVRIARLLGFKATYSVVLFATVAMTVICVVGGVIAYRNARAQAARDLAELTSRR